jgi:aminoglycoside phosphotransferase family enzyme
VTIEDEVAFLRRPDAWPARPADVEVIETHLSWVFLAGDEVYKLKKPVRFGQQDLRTVEARRRSCEVEVRLNQRLAPTVYLGAVPLGVGRDGALAVGRSGAPVDWMVRMRRLPADRFLDAAIRSGTVDPGRLRAAARLLVRFHRGLRPAIREPRRYVHALVRQLDDAARALGRPAADAPRDAVGTVHGALLAWIDAHGELLRARVLAGRIVEGHGDLRPEHVSLVEEPVVIDCLEFDVRLRTLDVVDELGYLALECERLGAPEVGAVFLDAWRAEGEDTVDDGLLAFHQAMRAFARASVAAMRLEDDPHARLARRLRDYLAAAEARVGALGAIA